MSSRRPRSAKEEEILARQRRMAAQITGIDPSRASASVGKPPSSSAHKRPGSTSSGSSGGASNALAKQQRLLQHSAQKKKLDEMLGRTSTSVKGSVLKRPGGNKPSSTSCGGVANLAASQKRAMVRPRPGTAAAKDAALNKPVTAAAAIAAARSRVGINAGDNSSSGAKKPPPPPPPSASSSSTSLKRAPVRKAGLASLISSSGIGTDGLKSKPEKYYEKYEPEDFWRNVRTWDFLRDLNDHMQGQRRGGGPGKKAGNNQARKKPRPPPRLAEMLGTSSKKSPGRGYETEKKRSASPVPAAPDKASSSSSEKSKQKGESGKDDPLPDVFNSSRQYIALWAPLCLKEAQAQILSEAGGEIPYWSKPGKGPVPVAAQTLKKDVGGHSDVITIRIEPQKGAAAHSRWDGTSPSFMTNDIVLLSREDVWITKASKGDLDTSKGKTSASTSSSLVRGGADASDRQRRGMLGHVEYSRRSIDGLTLKVSRKLWLAIGGQDMWLLKVGSNVTALREFTALCRTSSISLLGYVLGEKISHKASKAAGAQPKTDKAALLEAMGGSNALGKGFMRYAGNKFNSSQLGAISAASVEYGEGGFTLVKGPPGTGKTTTLVALLNALCIRQFNKYYDELRKIVASHRSNKIALENAAKAKPRLLVCAPSNAAVDNVILKIMEDGFIDGHGNRYNPLIVRVGVGKSEAVKDVALEEKVESVLRESKDLGKMEQMVNGYKMEIQRVQSDIARMRHRLHALAAASSWPLSKEWEIRIDESSFEQTGKVFFVNHKEKRTTFECPPPPEPGEKHYPATAMPEYRAYMSKVVKLVEKYLSISSKLGRIGICQSMTGGKRGGSNQGSLRQQLETDILDSTHIVMTTLGTAGNQALESANKFEVVVVDEAAQSVEPAILVALQLGSSHAILVGDPQQLPATIFSVSGRTTKYDRSLFQRLEEAGHAVHLLDTQYRMHPKISDFPRRIFYDGKLLDGKNVLHPEYANPLSRLVFSKFPSFQNFTVLDLDSQEERGGTSLSNPSEAQLALHLFSSLRQETLGLSSQSRVAVITPYAQQANHLRRVFSSRLGSDYAKSVEVNTVDAFQGREANIVIFSCVRAAGSRGIGFLSDVRRMNVALTRAKHFLFVIARCRSIVVNPYWRDLVTHARETEGVVPVPFTGRGRDVKFPDLKSLKAAEPPAKAIMSVQKKRKAKESESEGEEGEM
uniref:WW domain-containing protein n=1 Tax=Odontella aurita TaxID=265563 RepID=A0A7S4IUR5_9STRA|mmetsp:Transcript_3054/g.7954  ORF Transcript_3054/g.7954 Transcript_3054/m.7954 type:complete len:1202 (+) Transcript_3054:165-3770(+)